jgi:drug/metabolite transporter (DMT)-like permease
LLSAASFGAAGSFARSLYDAGWSPAAAIATRIGVAALVLIVPALIALRGRWAALRRGAGMMIVFGLVTAACQICYFNAIQHLAIGVALLLEYLGTVLVVGWLWLRHGQRPRRLTLAGATVAVLGLAFVVDTSGQARFDVAGVLWALGAAVGLAAFFFLSADDSADLPPVAVASGGMGIGAATLLVLGALGLMPLQATFGTVALAGQRMSWLWPTLGISLISAAIAYVTGIAAARRLGAKVASFIGLTEVVFAVVFAWLFLGELPTAIQLVGGVFIVAGASLVRIDELAAAPLLAAERLTAAAAAPAPGAVDPIV